MKSASLPAIIPFGGNKRNKHELAFLPAALEIIETPPSPVGRAIAITICVFFTLVVIWMSFARVDIISVAPGQIAPSGKTKAVQPFSTGVVRAIYVDDGQRVKAGEILVDLDPTISDADVKRARNELFAIQMEMARLRAALEVGPDPRKNFYPPQGADPRLLQAQLQLLLHQVGEYRAKISVFDSQIAQKEAERVTAAANVSKDLALLPGLQQQVEIRKQLMERDYGSKLTYLDILQQLVVVQKDLEIQRATLKNAEATLTAAVEQRGQYDAEFRRMISDQLATDEAKAASLSQDLIKAEEMSKRQALTAPVDGIVQQLAIHTVGGVVTPAQTLMVIVPTDSYLEIEAMVSNLDIGFVQPGQEVQIKVGTFDFTRYGLLHGSVLSISPDAVTQGSVPNATSQSLSNKDIGQPSQVGSGGGQNQGAVYAARVSLDRTEFQVENKSLKLTPGMAVTAEIKTGTRTIMSYILSKMTKFQHEAMRER